MMGNAKKLGEEILALADVKINGKKPGDIQIHNENFYSRVLAGGSLALGEAYMDGWWDCDKLDVFFTKVLTADLERKLSIKRLVWNMIKAKLFNHQSKKRAKEVGEKHYDAGNDIYKIMLDKRMVYTCAYWKNAKNLDEAQEAKLDLVCKKIGLKKFITLQ